MEPVEVKLSREDKAKALENVDHALLSLTLGPQEERPKFPGFLGDVKVWLSLEQVHDEIQRETQMGKRLALIWREKLW